MKWIFGLIIGLGVLYGVYRGLQTDSLASSSIAGGITGVLSAGIIWLIMWCARKFRVKTPGPIVVRVGTALYWIGCALGVYFLGLAVYLTAEAARTSDYSRVALSVIGYTIWTAFLCWFIGRGIRYMLGR
jgi:hypothetical protein